VFDSALNITTRTGRLTLLGQDHLCARSDQQEEGCENIERVQQHSQCSGGVQQQLEQGQEGGCESVRQEQQHSQSSGHEQLQYHLEREPQGLIGVSKYV